MAHHDPQGRIPEAFRDLYEEEEEERSKNLAEELLPDFGATGRHPEGKLTETDEGEIRFGIAACEGKVIMDFGEEMGWVGMHPRQAQKLARSLSQKAREARQQAVRQESGGQSDG